MEKEKMDKPKLVKELLTKNKAAALGCAVVLATGLLSGCTSTDGSGDTAQWEVYDEDVADDNYRYYGGYGGYFFRSGRPSFDSKGTARWSQPSGTNKSGGYGIMRGGSAVS